MENIFEENNYGERKITKKGIKILILIPLLLVVTLITLFSSFSTIKSGEVGLKVRFGKIIDTGLNEGFNLKMPYIEKIVKVNIKVQKTEITTESSSKDLQTIITQLAVNFRVKNDSASSLYKTVGNHYEQTVLIPAIQESIKSVMSRYTAEQSITMRNEVSDKCLEEIQNKVEKYGILIEDFNIIDLNFSVAYSQAIEEKQVAEQNVLTAQQELEKAKVEAEKKLLEAKTEKEANDLKKQSLTNELLIQKFIEKWNGELPKVSGSENIFDISGILESGK